MTIEQQIADSKATIKALEDRRRDAISIAEAGYNLEIAKQSVALRQLQDAQRKAISAAASHPREGERVWRMEHNYIGIGCWRRRTNVQNRVDGIIEVCRDDTVFAGNIGGSLKPVLGGAFVRAIKKDGTPGIAMHSNTLTDDWKPA
jgi:hypothetical protein